jgi:ketosteroid isomerase-like protein
MSEENVVIVRRAYEALAAGGVEAVAAFFAPDAVIHSFPEWARPPEYRGHDGLRTLLAA